MSPSSQIFEFRQILVQIAEKHKIDVTNLLISARGAIFTTPSGHISMTYVLITFNQSWQYIFVCLCVRRFQSK